LEDGAGLGPELGADEASREFVDFEETEKGKEDEEEMEVLRE
jgi:hypothetical protein